MSVPEIAHVGSTIVFVWLIYALFPAMRATMRADGGAKSYQLVQSGVWLLCLNRLTFAAVSQFDPGDPAALGVCYAFAFFAGCYMVFMCSLAKHRG